jgi:hypothetical protein
LIREFDWSIILFMGKKLLLKPRPSKPRGVSARTAIRSKTTRRGAARAPTLAELERQIDVDHEELLRRAEVNTRRLTGKDRF